MENKKDKIIIIGLIFVLIILGFNFIETIIQTLDYEKEKIVETSVGCK